MPETNEADLGADLRAAGAEVDAASFDEPAESSPAPATSDKPAPESEGEVTPPAGEGKAKSESTETGPEKTDPPANETPYQKAKREGKEREAKAWQKIEETKQAQAVKEAELEARSKQAPKSDYTAEDYELAASRAEREARDAEALDPEEAKRHAEFAQHARAEANRIRVQQWTVNLHAAAEANGLGDLKNHTSPLGEEFKAFLKEHQGVFGRSVEDSKIAVELFALRRGKSAHTESVSALQQKLEAVTKERDEARKAIAIDKSRPTRPGSDPDKDGELSEAQLRRMAAEADSLAA